MPRKIRRLSGPAVAIGYILLIPSILGMAACAILFIVSLTVGLTSAAQGSAFATVFAGLGTLAFVYIGIFCFVSGLVGWLLIMKKHVLQCVHCGAVVDAAAPIYSPPERSTARNFILGALFILGITGAIWAFVVAEAGTQPPTPTATTAEQVQPIPDNSTADPTQPAPDNPAAPAVSYDISTSREFAVPNFERCLMRAAMANHLTSASPEAIRQLLDACPNTSDGYVDVCLGDPGQTEMGCDMATGVVAASVLNHLNPTKGGVDSTAQPAPQVEPRSAPVPQPALSFQPSPESTDVSPAPVVPPEATHAAEPPQATEVTPGQTPDQVVAILGQPISITPGPVTVYNYPYLAISFVRGKVWKIHQFPSQ